MLRIKQKQKSNVCLVSADKDSFEHNVNEGMITSRKMIKYINNSNLQYCGLGSEKSHYAGGLSKNAKL